MESPRNFCLLFSLAACVVICYSSFSAPVSAAAPTRVIVPRATATPGSVGGEEERSKKTPPTAEEEQSKDFAVAPINPPSEIYYASPSDSPISQVPQAPVSRVIGMPPASSTAEKAAPVSEGGPRKKAPASRREAVKVFMPYEWQDETSKSYMPVVSTVPQKEEVQGQSRVIMLPEKKQRRYASTQYPQVMVPKETVVYKDSRMYAIEPEEEEGDKDAVYPREPTKPVMVEEIYYPKASKTTTSKIPSRTPPKMQVKTDKMDMVKDVVSPAKTLLMQAMEIEDQPTSVMVDSMTIPSVDIYPMSTMPKKAQYVKISAQVAPEDVYDVFETYMRMKMPEEDKAHERHPDCGGVPCYMTQQVMVAKEKVNDCGGVPCYMPAQKVVSAKKAKHADCGGVPCNAPQQVCEVPPCKVPSVCRDCDRMKDASMSATASPADPDMNHNTVKKVSSGFMRRYVDSRQDVVPPSPKTDMPEPPSYYTQVPCAYGADCAGRQYEQEGAYHIPAATGCKVVEPVHPMSSTPVIECSPLYFTSSATPQSSYSQEKERMKAPAGPATPEPRWMMAPPMPVPLHERQKLPVPTAEERGMPALPPASAPEMESNMPWKGEVSAPQEKTPETFGRRRYYYYYYYPSSRSVDRVVEVPYPIVYSASPRWRYVTSYSPYDYYTVREMTAVEDSPATVPSPVSVSPTTIIPRSSSGQMKQA